MTSWAVGYTRHNEPDPRPAIAAEEADAERTLEKGEAEEGDAGREGGGASAGAKDARGRGNDEQVELAKDDQQE